MVRKTTTKKASPKKEKAVMPDPVKKEVGAFDYVKSVMSIKNNMMRGTENDELAEKGYVPFLTNRALSFHADTVLHANEMNRRGHADNLLQYEYLLNSVRAMNRGFSWPKRKEDESIETIRKAYKCTVVRAREI